MLISWMMNRAPDNLVICSDREDSPNESEKRKLNITMGGGLTTPYPSSLLHKANKLKIKRVGRNLIITNILIKSIAVKKKRKIQQKTVCLY